MSKREKNDFQFSGNRIGFFRSLTPLSYILAGSVLATLFLALGLMLWGGEEEDEGSSAPERERITVTDEGVQEESEPIVAWKDKDPSEETAVEEKPEESGAGWKVPDSAPAAGESESNATKLEAAPHFDIEPASQEPVVTGAKPQEVKSELPAEKKPADTPAGQDPTAWIVQLSVNRRAELAAEWAEKIDALDLDARAYVLEREMDEGVLHILRMGGFASEEKARAAAADVENRLGLKGGLVRRAKPEDKARLQR